MSFLRHIGYRAHALWVPFVFLLFSGTRNLRLLQAAGVDGSPDDFAAGSPLERNILLVLMGASIAIVARRRVRWSSLLARNAAPLLLFALMAASILWSSVPWVSTKRFIKAIGLLGVLAVLLTDADPYQSLKFLLRRFCWFVLPLSLLYVYLAPGLGVGYGYDGTPMNVGICFSKNNFGQAAAIGLIFGMLGASDREPRDGRAWSLALAGLSLVALYVSHSATSLLVAAYGVGVLMLLSLAAYASIGYTGAIVTLLVVLAVSGAKLTEELVVRKPLVPMAIAAMGRDATLTGRTDLWRDVAAVAARRPVTGHGFGSFWVGDVGVGADIWHRYLWRPNQAHCGYLDVYAELGMLGLGVLALAVVTGVAQSLAMLRTDYGYGRARLVLIAASLAINVTESSFCRAIHLLWFVALAAIASPPAAAAGASAPQGDRV